MAKNPKMVICRNCNNPISEKAKICPVCGAKNKKSSFGKIFLLILVFVVVIGVFGMHRFKKRGEKITWNDSQTLRSDSVFTFMKHQETNIKTILRNARNPATRSRVKKTKHIMMHGMKRAINYLFGIRAVMRKCRLSLKRRWRWGHYSGRQAAQRQYFLFQSQRPEPYRANLQIAFMPI